MKWLIAFVIIIGFAVAHSMNTVPFGTPVSANLLFCADLENAKEAADGYADDPEDGAIVMFTSPGCGKGKGDVVYHALEYEKKGDAGTFRVYSFTASDGKRRYAIQ